MEFLRNSLTRPQRVVVQVHPFSLLPSNPVSPTQLCSCGECKPSLDALRHSFHTANRMLCIQNTTVT